MKRSVGPLGCIVLLPAVASAFQPLVFTRGIVRNIMDGDATTTQATAGLTWRFR